MSTAAVVGATRAASSSARFSAGLVPRIGVEVGRRDTGQAPEEDRLGEERLAA
jgi:hypothetical protein